MASTMTVRELAAAMRELEADGQGALEVRFAYQESYPLQDEIKRHDIGIRRESERSDRVCVYLISAGQVYAAPYAPSGIFAGRLEERPGAIECPACLGSSVTAWSTPQGPSYKCNRQTCGMEFDGDL